MEAIFIQIWKEARPLYKTGRTMDIPHIEWMMEAADKIAQAEKIDQTVLMPLVILHDVGYSAAPKDNPFHLSIRKIHMQEGAKLAKIVLKKVGYPLDKVDIIAHYISIHDEWAFGNHSSYLKNKILGIFNDLDFIWMASPKGFDAVAKIRGLSAKDMIDFLRTNEKLINRPFSSPSTDTMFQEYIHERENEISNHFT